VSVISSLIEGIYLILPSGYGDIMIILKGGGVNSTTPAGEPAIYNCHIHTFTNKNVPDNFLKARLGNTFGRIAGRAARSKKLLNFLIRVMERVNPKENDVLERTARFVATSELKTQSDIFERIRKQYPRSAVFVVLPMDMEFMELGEVEEKIDKQHDDLLALAKASSTQGQIIPFYTAHPERLDIVERVRTHLGEGRFQGIKIYPNLGYLPTHPRLMEVYKICEERGYPVISHCTPGGVWKYGLTDADRRKLGHPENYIPILEKFKDLRLCLAHFGGAAEWAKHLRGRADSPEEEAWVKIISRTIEQGKYPNLYTDISYTVFTPKVKGLYIDLVDYLKVMLSNENIRAHVLFGSDYYMVETEEISEKEVSILLRSRLGEDLFFQIAHTNPRKFLGIP
jgi:predicted TIM-barrel fold metal-dependent hydrolase